MYTYVGVVVGTVAAAAAGTFVVAGAPKEQPWLVVVGSVPAEIIITLDIMESEHSTMSAARQMVEPKLPNQSPVALAPHLLRC